MNLYELCQHKQATDPEYRRITAFFRRRCSGAPDGNVRMIEEFAIKHRGWPEDEAIELANDIAASGMTLIAYVRNKLRSK